MAAGAPLLLSPTSRSSTKKQFVCSAPPGPVGAKGPGVQPPWSFSKAQQLLQKSLIRKFLSQPLFLEELTLAAIAAYHMYLFTIHEAFILGPRTALKTALHPDKNPTRERM
ncbi:uncharacterized protein LOC144223674 isoform X1 [Crocuta crocuta]